MACTRAQAITLSLVLFYLLVLVFLPLLIWQLVVINAERHIIAWFVGGLFMVMAVILSLHDVVGHLLHYSKPKLQRHVIRILFMVPVYAIESWLALRYKEQAIYLETARECYEAFAIYNFYKLLEEFLIETGVIPHKIAERSSETIKHLTPFCCAPPWGLPEPFMYRCKVGVFQYVVIKILLTISTFICVLTDSYGAGEMTSAEHGFVYVTVITNLSQLVAMYCLILFYHTLKTELADIHPLPKLMCIKAVVFFTFWQGMLIAIFSHIEVIHPTMTYTQEQVAAGLQNFIICIEMFVAAVAHRFYFYWTEFQTENAVSTPFHKAAMELIPMDVFREASRLAKGRTLSKTNTALPLMVSPSNQENVALTNPAAQSPMVVAPEANEGEVVTQTPLPSRKDNVLVSVTSDKHED